MKFLNNPKLPQDSHCTSSSSLPSLSEEKVAASTTFSIFPRPDCASSRLLISTATVSSSPSCSSDLLNLGFTEKPLVSVEKLVSMAKKGASSSNPVATWNAHNISIFCDVCIKEVEVGHRPGTHFDKDGYANIRANFKAETRHDYDRKQLKNKWDALKIEWKLWKELIGKETGLGWNSSKGTVDAFEEWWNNKIQINKEYGKLRKKGISPEMEDKLDRMFSNTVATGEHAWAPSSGVLPPESRDESIGQIDLDDEEESETMQDLRQATRKRKKRATNQGDFQKKKVDKKGKKIGGAAKLSGQIDRLVEVYESRSSANSLMRPPHIGCSIAETIASVAQLPGCEPPSERIFNMNTYDEDVEELEDGLIICTIATAVETYYSKYIHKTPCMNSSQTDIIKPMDSEFRGIPQEIRRDTRYMPYFKDCIGAIDGVHVEASIPPPDQVPYIGRKGIPTQNVMVACNFDMQFTFACAGWEGTAHDTRVFLSVLRNPNLNFPKPPNGKYYLVDAGYPQMRGYLGPYKGERYHLPDFRRGAEPTGHKEDMPNYPFNKQVKIVIATMALHNYIRRYSERDRHFDDPINYCEESDSSDDDDEEYRNYEVEGSNEIEALRNRITSSLMNASN
ncbi:unnamed protein product [Malus baccata var. baccata]